MMNGNQFNFLPAGTVRLSGPMGVALDRSIHNRLKKINYKHLVDPFRFRNEGDRGWRCEFWGKIMRSAILSWYDAPDDGLLAIIRDSVADLLSTQTPDGCISSYPEHDQTNNWDVWGRKYVLLGLLRYYNLIEPDGKVKLACTRLVDHLMTQVGPGRKRIVDCGWHDGLAASSILGAIVGVYRISGERKYLDYALWIAESGCSTRHDIFAEARRGKIPAELGNGKAYEMMSCFQGLSELYLEKPEPEYLEAVVKFYEQVRDREIFITGAGGLKDEAGEYWFDGKFKQLRADCGALGETCVTTTWIHYCERVLRLTGDSRVADELEKSFYNAILGGMKPDGSGWIHMNPTPLAGASCKKAAGDQILRGFGTPFDGHDCCLAQGPEALAMAPLLAVLNASCGPVINSYENMTLEFRTPGGQAAVLRVSGGYPFAGQVRGVLEVPMPERFAISLRIPGWWNGVSVLKINGESCSAEAGRYFKAEREWASGDVVEMDFDLSARVEKLEDRCAVMCGPVLLAQDSRLGAVDAPVVDFELADADASADMNLVKVNRAGMKFCDYASAGNLFDPDNTLCVWFRRYL